jgi:hypothetical protein
VRPSQPSILSGSYKIHLIDLVGNCGHPYLLGLATRPPLLIIGVGRNQLSIFLIFNFKKNAKIIIIIIYSMKLNSVKTLDGFH